MTALSPSRYRGPLPPLVYAIDVVSAATAPAVITANRGKAFLVSTTETLDSAFVAQGATPGAIGWINTDAYADPYVFLAPVANDLVVDAVSGTHIRYETRRVPDITTGQSTAITGWFPYKTIPERALAGMEAFDLFDPAGVYPYYASLLGSVLSRLQATNDTLRRLRDPAQVPTEYLELAADAVGMAFDDGDPENIKRNKLAAAIPASKARGLDAAARVRLRQLGYAGYVTESWRANDVAYAPPVWHGGSITFPSNRSPAAGSTLTVEIPGLITRVFTYVGAPQCALRNTVLDTGNVPIVVGGPGASRVTVSGMSGAGIAAYAEGSITFSSEGLADTSPAAGTTITIEDGTTSVTFEFTNTTPTPGNTAVAIGASSAETLRSLVTAINASALTIGATSPTPSSFGLYDILVDASPVRTMMNTVAAFTAHYANVSARVVYGSYPHAEIMSIHPCVAPNYRTLAMSTNTPDIAVFLGTTNWRPPSLPPGWPSLWLTRTTNDAQLSLRAYRADGTDLFPYVMVGVRTGDAYRRSRGAVVFYDQYVPADGDVVEITAGADTVAFEFDSDGSVVPSSTLVPVNFSAGESSATIMAALSTAVGTSSLFALNRSTGPTRADTVVAGTGESGSEVADSYQTWIEVFHGTRRDDPVLHTPSSLISVHLNNVDGTPLGLPDIPDPALAVGGVGATPALDAARGTVLRELFTDVLPATSRVRQWLTDCRMPDLAAGGEGVAVGDMFSTPDEPYTMQGWIAMVTGVANVFDAGTFVRMPSARVIEWFDSIGPLA